MHENFDGGPARQRPSDAVGVVALGLQKLFVNDRPVCGRVLEHEHAELVEIYPEVYVAQAAIGVVTEEYVAASTVASECKAGERVFDFGRQPQNNGVFPQSDREREVPRVIIAFVIQLDLFHILPSDDVQRTVQGDLLQLQPRMIRGGDKEADNIGEVIV